MSKMPVMTQRVTSILLHQKYTRFVPSLKKTYKSYRMIYPKQNINSRSSLLSSEPLAKKEISLRRKIKSCRKKCSSCNLIFVKWSLASLTLPTLSLCSMNLLTKPLSSLSVTVRIPSSICCAPN